MEQIITRHRHELKRRELTVARAFHLTPHMVRIVLEGDDMADFVSLAPDDHVKLLVPAGSETVMREYTPRTFDARSLTLDFALHEAGPATAWARAARPGDVLTVAGPRGSAVVAAAFDWWLLIGDETALPAMGRWAEELPEGRRLITLAAIPSDADRQSFATGAAHEAHWCERPLDQAADPAPLIAAAQGLDLPEGRGFIWIAAEARVARALRDHFAERGHPRHWMKAAGYWTKGIADGADKALD